MTKDEILKYLNSNESDIQNANAALLLADFVFGFYADSHKVHGVNFSPVCSYFSYKKLNSFYQIIAKDVLEKVIADIYQDFKKDKKTLDEKINKHMGITDELDEIWKEYKQAEKTKPDKKTLKKFYKKFESSSGLWWRYAAIMENKGSIIENEITPSFAKRNGLSTGKAQDIISILSHPDEGAVFNEERKIFLQICLMVAKGKLEDEIKQKNFVRIFSNKQLKKLLGEYLKKYFWIKTDFYQAKKISEESVLHDALLELSGKGEQEINNGLKKIDNNFKKIKDDKRKILMDLKLSKEDKNDIYFVQRIIYWLDQRKLGMMKGLYYLMMFIEDAANFFGIKYEKIVLYSVSDFTKLLNSGVKADNKILRKRHDSAFMVNERGGITNFFYDETGKKMFEIATHVDLEELKGVVASTGGQKKVQGRVKIVLNPKGIDFEEGDILVTSMTRIEFVPLMRKAKAIITNEGGLACHAAIVSRELGLPAIIGTKNATNVLKNRDEIEMDMKTGEIKVLKTKINPQ